MSTVTVQFVKKSGNSKIGAMPCTNSDMRTCPTSCALKDNGCYASSGYYTRLNWLKVTDGSRGSNWSNLCADIKSLNNEQIWRMNVSGDLPHNDQVIDADKMALLIDANKEKRGFTYTHHDMSIANNRATIKRANKKGFIVNLSSDNVKDADRLKALNIAPIVTIVPAHITSNFTSEGGNKVVICPAAIKDHITCLDCKMCAVKDRQTIIAFPAHGAGKSKITFH